MAPFFFQHVPGSVWCQAWRLSSAVRGTRAAKHATSGCHYAQGYLFAQALVASEAEQ